MRVVDIIVAKRNGHELTDEQIRYVIDNYTKGNIPDYQVSALLMAIYYQLMTPSELSTWTDSMLHSGEIYDLSAIPGPKVDKHSTGGVGDKISLILAPLAVAAGLKVPMISGRGLGHTGGTLDKLETIPGFNVNLCFQDFYQQVEEIGCSLIGQTKQVVPADKKLYALRDATGTAECIPLISSSIMSKKLAEGIDALVLDVKVGSGAFMKDLSRARELAQTMISIGRDMNFPVRALLTNMDQPLGYAIGNALEVKESIETLQGKGPEDVTRLTIELVLEMLDAAKQLYPDTLPKESRQEHRKAKYNELLGYLNDGTALEIFKKIVHRQEGDTRVIDEPARLPSAEKRQVWTLTTDGQISKIDTTQIGLAAMELGAGRKEKDDSIDPGVGIVLHKKLGESVEAGDPVLTIHYNDSDSLQRCKERLFRAFVVGKYDDPAPLIFERIGCDEEMLETNDSLAE